MIEKTVYFSFFVISGELTAVDLETHALNVVYIVLNISVTGMPIRLLHFWYSIVYGVVYGVFTLVYHLAGGTNALEKPYVYSVIDWREPGTAAGYSVAFGIIGVTVIHAVLYGVHCLKLVVYYTASDCCTGPSSQQNSAETAKKLDQDTELWFTEIYVRSTYIYSI